MSIIETKADNSSFYLLLSSDTGTWKNACSEVYRLLKDKLAIESKYRPLKSPVKGLSMLELRKCHELPVILELLGDDKTGGWLMYCRKITPLEELIYSSEEFIIQRSKELFLSSDIPGKTWKIEINKRHSNISRSKLIEKIAREIVGVKPDYKVNLDKPDIILRIEIIGNETGIAVLESDQQFSYRNKIAGGSENNTSS
ncbi:MAG: THUMP domain-containing protein [Candidatus Hodarchaeales archaeon]|jgi:hypothetical protein